MADNDGTEKIKKVSGRPGAGKAPNESEVMKALALGREGAVDDPAAREMKHNRRINARTGSSSGGGGRGTSNLSFATGRPRDPMFYWKENNLPYDIAKAEELIKIRDYCNTPDAPVWMGDYSFKPMGEVQVGDEVIGWERGKYAQKTHLVRTKVLAVQRRLAPEVVEVEMESGRTIRCTPDHQWANPWYSSKSPRGWSKDEYAPAQVGHDLRFVTDPSPELIDPKEREVAAWLAGMYDGEGSGIKICQSRSYNPEVYDRICESLDFLGFGYSCDEDGVRLTGAAHNRRNRYEFLRFLNQANPTRRVSTAIDKLFLKTDFGQRDRVKSIRSLGPGEVVSMQTETGNYTAWGYASRNCRLLYLTHPVIASAIDVFSKYPLTGMELTCKDDALTEFYTTLFMDQLNYEEFLIDVGREYWTVGEAWPLGSFNELLGVWEDDELINPNDVFVTRSPFLKEPRFEIKLPEVLRNVIQKREPRHEYEALMRSYPELKNFMHEDARMPVSNILLKQLKFKADTFHPRGIPILMRGFRAVQQEEMLNAAMDAVASRLYTPLLLARIGASATDLGTTQPWIPTEDDLLDFEESLDAALAADFRVLVHHFACQLDSVFGREVIPDATQDFDRLTDRILQVFGMSKTMLSGASSGETYAADAMNRDLISQLLSTHQRKIEKLFRDRALVVAEAQEHYDYEERGGKRYPIMEEVLEVDEETGEKRIVEQPKLLVPDLKLKAMNMKSEADQRQFIEALRESGVPISDKTRLVNVPIDLDDEIERSRDEQVQKAVEAQETRKATFLALRDKGLPIPEDLRNDFEPKAVQAQGTSDTEEAPLPSIGMDQPAPTMALAPVPDDYAGAGEDGLQPDAEQQPNLIQLPRNNIMRPEESDEMRAGMPRAGEKVTARVWIPDELDDEGNVVKEGSFEDDFEIEEGEGHLLTGPRHIGMRRFARLDKTVPLDEQLAR